MLKLADIKILFTTPYRLYAVSLVLGLLLGMVFLAAASADSHSGKSSDKNAGSAIKEEQLRVLTNRFKQGRLAFTYAIGTSRDIYVANLGTGEITALVTSPALDEYPDWSPDGTQLAFYSDMSGDREIYSIRSDGSGLAQLTKSPGADEDPDWSPDGTRIVFHSNRLQKDVANIFVMNADGSSPTALTEQKRKMQNTVPRWSPRGDEIIYSTNRYLPGWDLMLYSSINGKSKLLTSGLQSFCRASWNPVGSVLAFSQGAGKQIDIWLQDKGKTVATRLTNFPGREYDAVWIESGQGIFFAGEHEPGSGKYDAFYIDIKTKVVIPVVSGPGSIRHLSWTGLPEVPPIPKAPARKETAEKKSIEGDT